MKTTLTQRPYQLPEVNFAKLSRKEAIDNLSVAFGECRDAIRRQAEAIRHVADDMDKFNEAFAKVKALEAEIDREIERVRALGYPAEQPPQQPSLFSPTT